MKRSRRHSGPELKIKIPIPKYLVQSIWICNYESTLHTFDDAKSFALSLEGFMRTISALGIAVVLAFSATPAKTDLSRLFDTWNVFINVDRTAFSFDSIVRIPDYLPGYSHKIGPILMSMTDSMVDLGAKGYPVREKKAAVFISEVTVPSDTTLRVAASADWWMRWYVNGKPVFNTDSGNGTNHFSPSDHRFNLPLKKGTNGIAVQVLAGSSGWRFTATMNPPRTPALPPHMMVSPDDLAKRGIRFTPDIVYLDGPRKEKLDLYQPIGAKAKILPVIVYMHGGGWAAGDKRDRHAQQLALAMVDSGYIVCSISYLLNGESATGEKSAKTPGPAWPHNLEDCEAATRFLIKNAGKYEIDPNRIVVYGTSAGGHLALLTAFLMPDTIRCGIINSGGYDVSAGCPQCFADSASPNAQKVLRAASPIFNIPRNPPPLLLLAGAYEDPRSSGHYARLIDSLETRHAVYQVEIGQRTGHVVPPDSRDLDMPSIISRFLRNYLR
jgi:acetyl esterase/lipase